MNDSSRRARVQNPPALPRLSIRSASWSPRNTSTSSVPNPSWVSAAVAASASPAVSSTAISRLVVGNRVEAMPSRYIDPEASSRYLDGMPVTVEAATLAAAGDSDPEVGLRAVAALRGLLEVLEALQVDNARAKGWSWQDIAGRLGVTKQAVHQKHGPAAAAGRR